MLDQHKIQNVDRETCLKQGTSCSPNQFCSLITITDEAIDSLRIPRYLQSEELSPK